MAKDIHVSSNVPDYANFTVRVALTSFAVSLVTSPLYVRMTAMQMVSRATPTVGESTRLTFVGAWFRSFPSYAATGQTKGALSVGSKHLPGASEADILTETSTSRENAPIMPNKLFHGIIFSQAEAVLPSYFANGTKLKTAGIYSGAFSLHKLKTLMFAGYPVRSLTCAFNFGSLLVVSDQMSVMVPIRDPAVANFVGGALSGLFNAVFTHPLNEAHDRQLLQTRSGENGRLKVVGTVRFFKQVCAQVKETGLKEATKQLMSPKGTLPVRMVGSMLTFSMIQGMTHLLPETPVTDLMNYIFGDDSGAKPKP